MLYHYPPSMIHYNNSTTTTTSPPNRDIYNWDTGVYLGSIPEANQTYNVVGNTNEYGLVIAETTFGGIEQLQNQKNAKIDYGSLIYITLQRTKHAIEAIHTMTSLMDEYGYASEGESFSLADANGQVWIMEVISRGKDKVGSVWVAMKIPDGYISAHSNQARITTFPRDKPEECLYSEDVVDLAKEIGIYQSAEDDPQDLQFSFSDTYNPVTFMGARASDARTWSIFSLLSNNNNNDDDDDDDDDDDNNFETQYQEYAMGKNLSNRMPLYIQPKNKLSMEQIMTVMSNHYEGTALSSNKDVGSGPYETPYRPRPLLWTYNDKHYHNERTVATQQTGWNFIAEIRLDKPFPLQSILWFAVDDSSTSPRFPVYGCSRDISQAYSGKGTQDGHPSPLLEFDMTKSFWVQNMVSNFVYSRWKDAYPFLQNKLALIHSNFQKEVKLIDQELMAVYDENDIQWVIDEATRFSVKAGDWLHTEWLTFYGQLFARYRDFFVIEEDLNDPICNCKVKEGGFSDGWKDKIVTETGDHYECLDSNSVPDDNNDDAKKQKKDVSLLLEQGKSTNKRLRQGSGDHDRMYPMQMREQE